MIIKAIVAIIGMAAVGWITWRLVNAQELPQFDDEPDARPTPPSGAAPKPGAGAGDSR